MDDTSLVTLKPPPLRPRASWSRILSGLRSLTIDRTPFRFLPPQSASAPWRGPLSLNGQTHEALQGVTPLRAAWRAYALPGSRLRAWCALVDLQAGPGVIRAALEAHGGGTECRAAVDVRAAGRWHEVRLDLPDTMRGEIDVVLSASSNAAASVAWGDPMLERRRTPGELLKGGLLALRMLGTCGLVRRAAAVARQAEDTERYRRQLVAPNGRAEPAGSPARAAAVVASQPLVSIITPVFNTDPVWLRRAIESVRQQTYPRWELCLSDDGSTDPRTQAVLASASSDPRIHIVRSAANRGIVLASNAALASATGEFVGFLDHDDELYPEALEEVVVRLAAQPDLDVVYTDEDKIDPSGVRSQPHFKPDWSPELLRSCMYTSHFTVMRRSLVDAVGGFRAGYDGAQDYDLMLRAAERTDRIAHVPRVLYGWRTTPLSAASSQLAKPWAVRAGGRALEDAIRREGVAARVVPAGAAGHFRVRYAIAGAPVVSVLITSSNRTRTVRGRRVDLLAQCVAAVARTTAGRAIEIVIAHQAPISPEAAAALRRVPHCAIAFPAESEPVLAARLNEAARIARGDHLLIVHDDVEALEQGWLDAMLEFSQQSAIGAVGPLLLHPDGSIEHAGIVLGAGELAAHAFQGEPAWTRGHMSNALDVRNCSAVSGACLLTRRRVFEEIGGFDERVGRELYDIDYGLRVREHGYRLVVTPHARLRHHKAAGTPRGRRPDEVARLKASWGTVLSRDPYYNPNFERRAATFRLAAGDDAPADPAT